MIIDRADIYKAGAFAATLARTSDGVVFAYEESYLESGRAVIASTLPLSETKRITPAGAVPPFFAGLLPEGRRLTNLRQTIKTSADDELSLLVAVGADPIGDVQVIPAGETPADTEPAVTVGKDFTEIRFADLLSQSGIIDPVGIAGVQEKVSARMLSLPVRRAHERFILKLNPPEFPHLVENEAFFLTLARKAGMRVADAVVTYDADQRPGLLVTRFDRVLADGKPISLAVEDSCQALDLWPADKYNVTTERSAHALIDLCTSRTVASRDVFRQVVFAWLTGNGDLHAKNLSVVTSADGETRIAPTYDIPSTVPYGDNTLALPIGGKRSGVSRRLFHEFAAALGLRDKAAALVIDQLLDATSDLDQSLADAALPFDSNTVRQTRRQLANRRRLLTQRTS